MVQPTGPVAAGNALPAAVPSLGFFAFALIAVNVVYFSGRAMPFKYLLPGLLFLIVFQVYWRVTFRFVENDVELVDCQDHH